MIPILAALFLLVGASYAVLKNKWLSLMCFGPITFVSVVLMGQIDVVCVLFIFISLILMQKALNAEKYFSLLLLAYLVLGVSMQFKTYGGLLLPAYLIYTLALAKHKKLGLKKTLFTLFTCFVAFLVAALLVWAPYPEWFGAIILHGESNWLLQLPSPLFQVPIWALGYALILCYIAVSVLRNPKRALWDSRYFIFHNFVIVAWFFVAVFTQPQWWMFLVPIAILTLDNFKSKYGVFCCILIFIVYLFYPMAMYFNMVGSFTSYHIPAVLITKSLSGWVFTLLAGALLFWIFELKRELGNMGWRSDTLLT